MTDETGLPLPPKKWRVVLEVVDPSGAPLPMVFRNVESDGDPLAAIDKALEYLGDRLLEFQTVREAWAVPEYIVTRTDVKKKSWPQFERYDYMSRP